MKDYGIVHGGSAQAIPLIIGKDTVYVHTNIVKIVPDPNDEFAQADLYSYNEIQYDKDEYIGLISKKNDDLETQVTDAQIALTDIYETILGG